MNLGKWLREIYIPIPPDWEEPEPSPNGEDDDGQEPGLEGGTKDGDGPSLD